MFKRAVLLTTSSLLAATVPVCADVITDWNEKAVAFVTARPGVIHRWTNMRVFADEVSQARIWAGFHYRFSTRAGQDMGRSIAEYVVKNVMQPATGADAR